MYVRKADVRAYGRTPGCKGCRNVIIEKATCSPHSRECRVRMEKMICEDKTDDRTKKMKDRFDHYLAQQVIRGKTH